MKRTFAYKSTIVAQTFCYLKQTAVTAIKLQGESQPSENCGSRYSNRIVTSGHKNF